MGRAHVESRIRRDEGKRQLLTLVIATLQDTNFYKPSPKNKNIRMKKTTQYTYKNPAVPDLLLLPTPAAMGDPTATTTIDDGKPDPRSQTAPSRPSRSPSLLSSTPRSRLDRRRSLTCHIAAVAAAGLGVG